METKGVDRNKTGRTILIIARVLATLLVLFFSVAILPKIAQEIIDGFKGEFYHAGWEGIMMELTYLVFIIGFIISWWRKCLGGLLILLSSIIQMGPFLIIDGNLGSLIFGIPLFVVGCLFLIICLNY